MIYSLQTFGKHTENDKSNCTNILMQMNFQQKKLSNTNNDKLFEAVDST